MIRGWFAGDHEATETLDRLEAKPDSPARTAELAEVLQPRLEADPRLVVELTRLVEQAKADPQTASFVTTVADNARVGRITNIGQITSDPTSNLPRYSCAQRPGASRVLAGCRFPGAG